MILDGIHFHDDTDPQVAKILAAAKQRHTGGSRAAALVHGSLLSLNLAAELADHCVVHVANIFTLAVIDFPGAAEIDSRGRGAATRRPGRVGRSGP